MRHRELPYFFYPVHHSGYLAPAIVVEAGSREAAYQEAFARCYLIQKFPEHWRLK